MNNESGIYPQGDRVLVRPEELEEVSEGGIILANESHEKYSNAQVYGHLVDVGADCWSDYSKPFAAVGDRIMIAKYGGVPVVGKDGEKYRVLNDVDITATLDDEVGYYELNRRQRVAHEKVS